MKKSLLLPLFFSTTLQAGFYFDVGPTYRIDWQTSESAITESHVASHIKDRDHYKHLSIWEIAAEIETDHCNPFYVGAQAKYGWVGSGVGNSRTPFISDTEEVFDLRHTQVTGHTYDLQLYAGYRFYFLKKCLSIIPCGGYEHHEKRLIQNNGINRFNDLLDVARTTDNFTHKDHIRGPFAGIDFEWSRKTLLFFGGFHWNFYKFNSRGHDSFLITPSSRELTTFDLTTTEDAHIGGPSAFLGAHYNLNKCVFISLKTSYYYTYLWNGHKYNDVFIEDFIGSVLTTQTLIENRLNSKCLEWSSWSIELMLGYHF